MKNRAIAKNLLFAAGMFGLTSLASAQVFEMEQLEVLEGTTSVDVEWQFTYEFDGDGTPVSSVGFDITFDEVILTNADLSNCIIQADAQTDSCQLTPAGDTIRISISNFDDTAAIGNANGVISFTVDGAAEVGDVSNLPTVAVSELLSPADTTVDITSGSVTIVDIPPEEVSELSVSPDPLDFATVDVGDMPEQGVITATNSGGADSSLTVSSAAYTGDTEFSIVNNACEGTTLAAGESCNVTVEFDSGGNGTFTGAVDFASDADNNPSPSVSVLGSADSVANLSVTPPFGPVDLGTIVVDTTGTANGSISNSGSAAGDFSCTLSGDAEISTDPSSLSGPVPAGESVGFSISCAVPETAEEGDTYSASLVCTGDNGFSGTHDISCAATEFEPLPVPTMTNWSIALFALMMLLVGGFSIRFLRT